MGKKLHRLTLRPFFLSIITPLERHCSQEKAVPYTIEYVALHIVQRIKTASVRAPYNVDYDGGP